MEQLSHVHDCTGNLIFLYQYVLDKKQNLIKISHAQYAQAVQTISKPAIIIKLNNGRTRYYYRATYWDKTLLIGVCFVNGIWEVKEFLENPSGLYVLTMIKKNLVKDNEAPYLKNEITDSLQDDLL